MLHIIALAGAVLAAAPAPQPEVPPPVLYCYANATQVGTVARREFKDAWGHVVKEIFYTSSIFEVASPKCAEDTLRVQRIRTFEHDANGRPIVERVFSPDERMQSQSHMEYEGNDRAPVRRLTSDPSGLLRTETRWLAGDQEIVGDQQTVLEFDDDGRVARVHGQMPGDVEYAIGWGPATDGWTCGIGALRRAGAPEDVAPAVHLRNLTSKNILANFARRFEVRLLDAVGRSIRERPGPAIDRVARFGYLLFPQEAAYNSGPDLRERFGRLDPGRYRLLAWHPHPETGALLECGMLEVLIK